MRITNKLAIALAIGTLGAAVLSPSTAAVARSGIHKTTSRAVAGLLVFQQSDPSNGEPSIATLRLGRSHSHPHLLTPGVQSEHADWTPDGRFVVYDNGGTLDPPGGHVHLFRISVHGGASMQLTSGDGDQGFPSADPSGRYVAFDGNWPDGSAAGFHAGVGVVNLRTGALREITRNPHQDCGGPCSDSNPAWSPDGRLIVFVRIQGNASSLVTVHPNGRHLRPIVAPEMVAGNPDWSPNGDLIVFNDNDNGGSDTQAENIRVISRNGGPARRLTHNAPATDSSFQPTWSSDGSRIAFVHLHHGDDSTHLFVMTAAGTGQRDLEVDAPLPFSPAFGPSTR